MNMYKGYIMKSSKEERDTNFLRVTQTSCKYNGVSAMTVAVPGVQIQLVILAFNRLTRNEHY